MLSSFLPVVTLALSLALHVKGHALITPALGVTGTPERNDATGFNAKNPCGKANIATDLVASNSVAANAQGQFTVKVVNFNGGVDGSRKIKTAQVDPTGEGKTFTPMTIITNGLESPTSDGESDVTVALPPGTVCSGGATKNLCLASFVTDGNFGNCVGVTNGGAAAPAAAGGAAGGAGAADATTTSSAAPAASSPAEANNATGGNAAAKPADANKDKGGDADGKKKKKKKHGHGKDGKGKDGEKGKADKKTGSGTADQNGQGTAQTEDATATSTTSSAAAAASTPATGDDATTAAQRRYLDETLMRRENPLHKSGKMKSRAPGKPKNGKKHRKGTGKQRQDKKKTN